jgi:WD repeat-containing protein 23
MYDTSNPYDWKYYKTVDYPFGQWTITDATLSPDNRFLVYSSIRSQAYMATTDPEDNSDPSVLDFSTLPGQGRRRGFGTSHFGVCLALMHSLGLQSDNFWIDMVSSILWRWT